MTKRKYDCMSDIDEMDYESFKKGYVNIERLLLRIKDYPDNLKRLRDCKALIIDDTVTVQEDSFELVPSPKVEETFRCWRDAVWSENAVKTEDQEGGYYPGDQSDDENYDPRPLGLTDYLEMIETCEDLDERLNAFRKLEKLLGIGISSPRVLFLRKSRMCRVHLQQIRTLRSRSTTTGEGRI